MPPSLILTCHPFVHFRFQSEYREASEAIWPFEKLARQIVSKDKQIRILTPWEQRRLIQKGAPASVRHCRHFIRRLKREEISVTTFQQAVAAYPFSIKKKAFFQEIADLYAWYEKEKIGLDDEDVFSRASQRLGVLRLKRVLILAHDLSAVEEKFVRALTGIVPQVERISLASLGPKKTELQLTEAPTARDEVETICAQIQRLIKQGVSLRDIFVFFAGSQDYRAHFHMVFERQGIPVSFWNGLRDLDRITVLPWHPNTLVFGRMNTVFLAGLSSLSPRDGLVSEEEKRYFNKRLMKEIFAPHGARMEKTKQLLHWTAARVHRLYFSAVSSPSKPVRDFLSEYQLYTKNTTAPNRFKKQLKRPLPHEPGPCFRKDRHSLLPKVYSARSLTQYQKCPLGFLVKECLQLLPVKPAADELTPLQEGNLLHEVLRSYFSLLKQGQTAVLDELLAQQCGRVETAWNISIFPDERFRLKQTLAAFLEREQGWRDSFSPSFFEEAFGGGERPVLTLSRKGKSIQLKGVIDRIDVDPEQRRFRVIDYKSGGSAPSEKEVMAGRHFQLTLYAMAVETLILPGWRPQDGYFYRIKQADRRRAFEMPSKSAWEALKERTLEELFQQMVHIEALRFPGTPDQCFGSCELRNFCAQEAH